MPYVPPPSGVADTLADLDRRVRNLEATARSGVSRIAFGFQDEQVPVTAFDVWFTDNGTFSLPAVTLATGSRAIIMAGILATNFGLNVSLRSQQGLFGVGVDGDDPETGFAGAELRRTFYTTESQMILPLMFAAQVNGLTRGEHTFSLWGFAVDDDPGAPSPPIFDDSWLMVIPLDVA